MQQIVLRNAREQDLAALLAIKNHYIVNTSAMWNSTPLTQEQIRAWWSEHAGNPMRPVVVACDSQAEGPVVGYASLSTFRGQDGYRYTAENSVYVLPGYEGQGLGFRLMDRVLRAGWAAGLKVVTAWIDADNARSVAFHEKMGFEPVGTMKDVGFLRGERRSVTILDLELARYMEGSGGGDDR